MSKRILVLAIVLGCSSATNALDEVGYWRLNNNANDDSTNSNNGTLSGGSSFISGGMSDSAVRLDGVDGLVTCPDLDILQSPNPRVSVSLWIKGVPSNGFRGLVVDASYDAGGLLTGYKFSFEQTSLVCFVVGNGSSTMPTACFPSADIDSSKWQHLVGTYDGTNVRIYLNRIEKDNTLGDALAPNLMTESSSDLYFGFDPYLGATDRYYDGDLDEIRIWDYALGQSEIDALGPAVPAVSEWGMAIMAMLVVTAGTIVFRRRALVNGG